MTVQQLIQALRALPPRAAVLLVGDAGLSPLGGVDFLPAQAPGLPAEVLLQPDLTPD